MALFESYINLIFLVKIIFVILALTNRHLKNKIPIEEPHKNTKNQETQETQKTRETQKTQETQTIQKQLEYWKERIELLFKFLMALLLIYLFNPRENRLNLINYKTKLLLFLFGIILLFTAHWEEILKDSKIILYTQDILHT